MTTQSFTEEVWRNLPADTWEAAEYAAKIYFADSPGISDPPSEAQLNKAIEAAGFYRAFIARYSPKDAPTIEASDHPFSVAMSVSHAYKWLGDRSRSVLTQRRLQAAIERAQSTYTIEGMPSPFKLEETQIAEIQKILHEVGALIRECDEIDEQHRQRALQALAELQAELDKKTTTLERITAFAFEMEMLAGRLWKSAGSAFEKGEAMLQQANELAARVSRILLITGAAYAGTMALPAGIEQGMVIMRRHQLALPGGHEPVQDNEDDVIDAEIEENAPSQR